MPGAHVLPPSACLLLLLLALYSSAGSRPPRHRFEYKFSFKGPRLAFPGAGIPFWSHHGDAILGLEEVRLAPSMSNCNGAVWSKGSVPFPAWEVEIQMRVTGPGHRGAQGMAIWYTRERGHVGSVPGEPALWDGLGIFLDASGEDAQNSPAIRVLASDGCTAQEQLGSRALQVLGSCRRDFRNRPYPFKVRITYWGQRLRVASSSLTPSDPEEVCIDVGPLLLTSGGYFGVSAATSTLADDHDVLSFLTFSLNERDLEAAPQPFLEMEQLRLARQLERLRLALGTLEGTIPQPNSEAQEEVAGLSDLEETLRRHRRILQALQALSRQLAQTERQWKKQLESLAWGSPEGVWDSAKVSTLFSGQQTLLQALQEMRDVAAHMASRAQVLYLPMGTEHHFLELDQMLSLLQKDLQGLVRVGAKAPRPTGEPPGAFTCLLPSIFLPFLLIQTIGFLCYMNISKQKLDKSLQESLSMGSLPQSPVTQIPRLLGALRRQPVTPNMLA